MVLNHFPPLPPVVNCLLGIPQLLRFPCPIIDGGSYITTNGRVHILGDVYMEASLT